MVGSAARHVQHTVGDGSHVVTEMGRRASAATGSETAMAVRQQAGPSGPGERARAEQAVHQAQADADRRGGSFAALFVAPSGLAELNDRLGREAGDRALQVFADRLKQATRADDFCLPYEGPTFLCVMREEVDPPSVDAFCRRLAEQLGDPGTEPEGLGIVIGAALYPLHATADAVIAAGKAALRQAQTRSEAFRFAGADDPMSAAPAPAVAPTNAAAPAAEPSGAERRTARRPRVLKRGQIITNGRHSSVDCTVRDLTDSGARLRVDTYFAPPDAFEFTVVGSGQRRLAKLRWQVGKEIGIEFVG
jgi:GGDEF domain-containing protein